MTTATYYLALAKPLISNQILIHRLRLKIRGKTAWLAYEAWESTRDWTDSFTVWYQLSIYCHDNTLFSESLVHENHPNFLRSLGNGPRPRVILILSNGLESNSHIAPKTICKLDMTRGQGQWPRVTGRTGQNQCAPLLEKSVRSWGCL